MSIKKACWVLLTDGVPTKVLCVYPWGRSHMWNTFPTSQAFFSRCETRIVYTSNALSFFSFTAALVPFMEATLPLLWIRRESINGAVPQCWLVPGTVNTEECHMLRHLGIWHFCLIRLFSYGCFYSFVLCTDRLSWSAGLLLHNVGLQSSAVHLTSHQRAN